MFNSKRYLFELYTFSFVFRLGLSYNAFSFVHPPLEGLHKVGNEELGFEFSEKEMKEHKIWPRGIIPYFIDDFSFDKGLRDKIRIFLEKINDYTGLQFQELPSPPKDDSTRWVLFVNRIGQLPCEDYNTNSFTDTGVQRVVLGYDCVSAGGGALAPTVLALAGVPPQHNAPDRDDYVAILTENIIPDKLHLFQKLQNTEWLFHRVAYDYLSAGHYDLYKYTKNGNLTIKLKQNIIEPVGEANFLSYKDILKIKYLYNFITKSKKHINPSECSKIFKPGKKTLSNSYSNIFDHKPTDKPVEYLGGIHKLKDQKRTTVKYDTQEKYVTFALP